MTSCATCGAESVDHAKYCSECGARLDERRSDESGTRRVVTALFCDVVGSTGLGEQLDPEALRAVMVAYVDALREVVVRHGGRAGDLLGDGVLGVFGVPEAHEDDALRAVRAAAEIVEVVGRAEGGGMLHDALSLRIGVNTGEVLSSDADTLVLGDPVNVAARLQSVADPGDILLGASTYRLVRDAVEVEWVGEIRVKGRMAAVNACRLVRVLEATEGVARRSDAPLVGREPDVAIVLQTFERCCRDERAQLVTVVGDPGVGKTRLVTEVVRRLEPAARVVTGHCRSYGDGITFLPLADALDDLTSQMGDLREVLEPEPDAAVVTATARALASGTSSAVEGAFPSVRRLFEAAARDAPLVVVVEDIHWAEPNLLDLLEYVVRETRARLLVICLARPELLDMRPSWGGGRVNASTVLLYPLSADDAATLATELGQSGNVAEIAQASGGNPLFIEHLVALARDSGIDPHTLRVPEEIQGLLSARLDQLDVADRHIVHVAAVIGMVVDAAELAMLTGDGVDHAVEALDRLCARELFRPLTRHLAGARVYEFSHALVREAAYGRLSRKHRADLHERFCGWLSTQPDARPELLAYHLERAYLERKELGALTEHDRELALRAGELLAQAGGRTFQQLDHPSASNLLSRARGLLPEEHPLLAAILPDLGISLIETSEFAAAEDVLNQAVRLAQAKGDLAANWRARAERERLAIYLDPARPGLQELLGELKTAIARLEASGDDVALARCWSLRVDIECCLGGVIGRGESAANAVSYAVAAGSRADEERAVGYYTWELLMGRTPLDEAIRICEALYEERRDQVMGEAVCLNNLAAMLAITGRWDMGRQYINRSIEACDQVGFAYWGTHSIHIAGQIELWANRPAQAEPYLRTALDRFRRANDAWFQQIVAADLADTLVLLDRADEGEALLGSHRRPSGDPDDVAHVTTVQARVLLALNRPEDAENEARAAIHLLEQSDYVHRLGYAWLELARSLHTLDRAEEAEPAAEEAHRLFHQKGHSLGLAAASSLLDRLRAPA
jgi:class 3 adenylate cyclase/tetratricopeptide (TPR) repeat protein